eukprot:TRINITY_DN100427_c0_g1_i1.p1 TRINITY_DN100427_c0_g1~~TRINITY_DN100427_c0_g1_i1.p1  ORF type:complete len:729 (+),score=115.13 TRINITY_DN100427_c0_g1_i1:59-2188(+)
MPGGSALELSPLLEVVVATSAATWLQLGRRVAPVASLLPIAAILNGSISLLAFGALRCLKRYLDLVPLSAHVDELLATKCDSALRAVLRGLLAMTADGLPSAWRAAQESLKRLEARQPKATFDSAIYVDSAGDEFRALWDEGVFSRTIMLTTQTQTAVGVTAGCAAIVLTLVVCAARRACEEQRIAIRSAAAKRAVDRTGSDDGGMQPSSKERRVAPSAVGVLESASPDLVFIAALVLFYSGLSAMVWRLRVLALPVLAVAASQLLSPRLWTAVCPQRCREAAVESVGSFFLALIKWWLAVGGVAVSACYFSMLGSLYSTGLNPDTEMEDRLAQFKMFASVKQYIARRATDQVVLGGDATTLASARLALRNISIVAHPHYEDPDARRRFKDMKEYFYACASAKDAHAYAVRNGITHVLLDMTKLAPSQALTLSAFYDEHNRCKESLGAGLLGMNRTFFQLVLKGHPWFKSLHVVGSYVFLKVLEKVADDAASPFTGPSAEVEPAQPESWAPLLARCSRGAGAETTESCGENLGLLIRAFAHPLRQHRWVRSMAIEAQRRYPGSATMHALLAQAFDYDLSDFNAAAELYRKAAKLAAPADVSYWLTLGDMLSQAFGRRAGQEILDVMEHVAPYILGAAPGPVARDLAAQQMCQAAAWSRSLQLGSRWEAAFWQMAKLRSRFGCVHSNWALIEGRPRPLWQLVWDFLLYID